MIRAFLALTLLVPAIAQAQEMDHSKMDHSKMDHSKMDHSKMDHSKMDHSELPREPIPEVTDADRKAAFPDLRNHIHGHGTRPATFWLVDRLEATRADGQNGLDWEVDGWVGGDVRKLRIRSEGHSSDGKVHSSHQELLYSQGIRAWWDVNAGIRHDIGDGPSRTWATVGIDGLTPGKVEFSAAAFLRENGHAAAKIGAEYETLLTNRAILQWRSESEFRSKSDPQWETGKGWVSTSTGARLRYEITRQFAPYVGVERQWRFDETRKMRRLAGEPAHETRIVAGVRMWF